MANNKKVLVVGGSSGLGLSIVLNLLDKYDTIYIADRNEVANSDLPLDKKDLFEKKISIIKIDLFKKNLSLLKELLGEIDSLFITAGFGRIAKFEQLTEVEINKLIQVDMTSPIQIIKLFYDQIKSKSDFYTAVIGSIAGHITSPLFTIYGAAKSGLCSSIASINAELAAEGFKNRILDVSPGVIKGSRFYGGKNDLDSLNELAKTVIEKAYNRETLYIPQFEETYKGVIERDRKNPIQFGVESYNYKVKTRSLDTKPQVVIGYLSGTFDLFHIGHLNLLKRAKEQCDYLIVGVHDSGAWKGKETFIPFEERLAIVGACEYVDEVHESFKEDSDAWNKYHFDKLFVGSDYKGSERFNRYEEFFKDKGVQIVYFPYTKGTSSTQLREKLSKK